MKKYLILSAAYGRKYTELSKVEEDWNSGKDFQILGVSVGYKPKNLFDICPFTPYLGRYCSIRDINAIHKDDLEPLIVCTINYSFTSVEVNKEKENE